MIWALGEARARGRAVDEPALAELTTWVAESGDGKTGIPRPAGLPRALNEKAVSLALGLVAQHEPDSVSRNGIKLLLQTVKGDQVEDGRWVSWPETRPPIFGNSDERATLVATLALSGASNEDREAAAARDRAVAWLAATKSDGDPQSMALRMVLWQRLGRGSDEVAELAGQIVARQRTDGGWSQTDTMASDAWATGQALYALAHAGFAADQPAVRSGQAFLVGNQRADGSWPMTSRPTKPGDEGAKSLIPIIGAGSSWAILGLARGR